MKEKTNQDSLKQKKGMDNSQSRKCFSEPKLTFIKPKLTKHGDATKITGQFFGTFNPTP